jgi:1A family penicillin-binding protein
MSARRRRLERRQSGRRLAIALQVMAAMVIALLVVSLSGAAVAMGTVDRWLEDIPNPDEPGAFEVAQATRIYSADGKLLARLYLENRTVVPISKISTDLVNAVVAIEDERFYEHKGVDPIGLMRALVANLTEGFGEEGASTITQQYIRNTILLDERTDITLARKIREAYLAMELEKRYDKREILEMYLNAIYFGEGAYGAQAASRTFFSKGAGELKLSEAALLAALPQQPGRLNPYENPEAALARRNLVLARMLENGYITQEQYDKASKAKLKLRRAKDPEDGIYEAPFFVAHVKKLLQAKFDEGVVFKGGLRVTTTLDTRMQDAAERAVKRGVPGGPEAALVSLDPRNGYVKAVVGGRNYRKNKFNLATQGKRQPGSAFKTFTLVTALDQGMPPYYRINSSSPAYIPTKPKPWLVSNSEGSGHGAMTLERATQMSVNTVFARVAYGIGPKKVARTAKKMGIKTPLTPYPSIALGAQNVSPLEMASAYGTLATNGRRYDPIFITRVLDHNGEEIFEADPDGEQVIKPSVAYAATRILKGVITSGTARRAAIGRPAAGKTGTSQNHRDVWFVGYTPQLVTAVWVGYPKERTIYVNGSRAFGGTVCAPIWADYMRSALSGQKVLDFKPAPRPKYSPSKFRIPGGSGVTSGTASPSKPGSGSGSTGSRPPSGGNTGGGTKPDGGTKPGGGTGGGNGGNGGGSGGGNTTTTP